MASNIDPTKPTSGTASTADVRTNFAAAVAEIEALQSGIGIVTLSWAVLTGTPTSLAGYGIADALASSQKGAANGVAELDGAGKVPSSQMPVAFVEYKGTWDADTNSPDIAASDPQQGDLYRVTVAGTTSLSGITDWEVGDLAVYNGTSWDKWDTTTRLADDPAPELSADLDPNGFGIDGPVPKARAAYRVITDATGVTTAADINGIVVMDRSTAQTLTLHDGAPNGAMIRIVQWGEGAVTIDTDTDTLHDPDGDIIDGRRRSAVATRIEGTWQLEGALTS